MDENAKMILVVILASIVTMMAFVVPLTLFNGWSNQNFEEGYEITIQGQVQLHRMEYSRGLWWDYPYTEVELRTFSDYTYSLNLYGHYPLEHEKLYTITYTRISPLGHHQQMIGKVIKIEGIEGQ